MKYDSEYLNTLIKEKGVFAVVESIDERFVEDKEIQIILRTIKHSAVQLAKSLDEQTKKRKITK
jgi:hypothetical protein